MSDIKTETPTWWQKEPNTLQILFHLEWEFPLIPMYATAAPAPDAEAMMPNKSFVKHNYLLVIRT